MFILQAKANMKCKNIDQKLIIHQVDIKFVDRNNIKRQCDENKVSFYFTYLPFALYKSNSNNDMISNKNDINVGVDIEFLKAK